MNEGVVFNSDGTITMSELTYKSICLKMGENSPTYLYLLSQKEKNIVNAIKYLEEKRIRNKAIVDVDVLEGILNELDSADNCVKKLYLENRKYKEVIDKAEKILNECKLLMPHEFDLEEQVDNVIDILKEVSDENN